MLIFDRLWGKRVGFVEGVVEDVEPDVIAVVVMGLDPSEEVVWALDPVANSG